ncbi:SH3 domain-containing protein [Caloramator sp. mosi_1]|uniref:SH3 domain-containing protein n=1 Tax=Caloramator sp. mosi_1 TaxID=3023090 RepID=UPI003FCDA95D
MSNLNEERILSDVNNQKKIALCIAKGIGEDIGVQIVESRKGRVNARAGLNVRSGPSTKYPIVRVLKYGEQIDVYTMEDGWFKINDGWVFGQYVDLL